MIEDKQNEAQYTLDSVRASISRIKADISAVAAGARGAAAQVESAVADIDVAKADLKKTLAEVQYLEVRAPFDGLITERLVDPGALVRPAGEGGAPLFKIENVATMRAVMFVPITDAASVDQKDNVVIHSLQGHPEGMTIPSAEGSAPLTVSRFANSLDRGSRMMRVEVDLKNPVDPKSGGRLLKPGGYGKASLSLHHYSNIDLVPEAAVVKNDSGAHVVVVNEKTAAEFVPVTVMHTTQGQSGVVPVRGSLEGQRIIASNPGDFKDNENLSTDTISNLESY